MKRILSSFLIYALFLQTTFAAGVTEKFPTDTIQMGKSGSSDTKKLIFDVGDGVTNPNLNVDVINKDFEFSKTLNIIGNLNATLNSVVDGSITAKTGLTLGSGVQADKSITVDRGGSNPFLKWDEAIDSWVFSNDGSIAKKLGSGSGSGGGGGTNGLLNDSFEDFAGGVFPGWTNSGGTVTQGTYPNGLENDTKFINFVASGSGQYFEQVFTVPTTLGAGCQIDFKKVNTTVANLFKIEALDASNNVLATANIPVLSWQKIPTLSFLCPTAGTALKARVTSLAAGTFQGDKAYNGSNQNIAQIKVSNDISETSYTANFTGFGDRTSATLKYSVIDGKLRIFGRTNMGTAGGTGTGSITLPVINGVQAVIDSARITDPGNTTSGAGLIVGKIIQDGSYYVPIVTATATSTSIVYTGARTAGASSSTTTHFPEGTASWAVGSAPMTIDFEVPIVGYSVINAQDAALSNEQSGWYVDVNIGGANFSGGVASSYTELTDAGLNLVPNSGSAPTEIACSGTNPSTGTTCAAGNESMGIAFTPPMAGRYRVCTTYGSDANAGGTVEVQLIETPNNAQTIIQEGNGRTGHSGSTAPVRVCGNFNFNDTSKRTVRLMYEKDGGTYLVYADRSSTIGQRDIHFTVENITFSENRPVLTGGTNVTPGITNQIIEDLSVSFFENSSMSSSCTTNGACFIKQIGSGFSGVTKNGLADYTLTTVQTYSELQCISLVIDGTNGGVTTYSTTPAGLRCSNCNSINFGTAGAGTGPLNVHGTIFCKGQR